MSWTNRLPAGDLVIDLRPAHPPDVVGGSVFSEVAQDLDASELVPHLRVWVLHDATLQWCANAGRLERGLRAWLAAAAHGRLTPDGSDAVILPPAASRNAELVAAIQALGLPVHAVRRGGGLPLDTVELDGRSLTAVTTKALPPSKVPSRLQPALDSILGR